MIRTYIEKNPMIMIVVGLLGVSMSAIFVRLSDAPSAVTAAYRLLWTVLLMTPVTLLKREPRGELARLGTKNLLLCAISGVFLAVHFTLWFESLQHTSVASSATACLWAAKSASRRWQPLPFRWWAASLSRCPIPAAAADTSMATFCRCSPPWPLRSTSSSAGRCGRQFPTRSIPTRSIRWPPLRWWSSRWRRGIASTYEALQNLIVHGIGAVIVGLLLAVFSTIMGHSVFNWCLKYFSPSFVSASKLAEPVLASVIAVFLFSEIPSAGQIFGGMIILAGVLAYSRFEKE